MASYQEIKESLRKLYLNDSRPWLVGFSDGKENAMVTSFHAKLSYPLYLHWSFDLHEING